MSADRLLSTLLRALHSYTDQQDTPRLFGTAVSLYNTLNNPLNITLLTTQLLSSQAIWARPDGLRTSLSFMGVFHSAAIKVIERQRTPEDDHSRYPQPLVHESRIPIEEWILAIIKGADENSERSLHPLVLGGLLIGIGSQDDDFLSTSPGITLQSAFVKAINLAVLETSPSEDFLLSGVVLALNHTFAYLSDLERTKLDYDRLLPVLMNSTLHSTDGLMSGYFLGAADGDVRQVSSNLFNWSKASGSYRQVERILSGPLASNLGPLSRLIAHTIDQVHDSWLVLSAIEDLADFSRRLLMQWRQNKLSEIDGSEEVEFLHEEARRDTTPTLWRLLRATLFAVVIILRTAVGRVMGDSVLASNDNAPHVAQETLEALRSLSFIHTRLGSASFSQYTFTYLAAIDILAAYPSDAEGFLQSIAPSELGSIPGHPTERCLDLFFLNTAEQFTFSLSPQLSEELVVTAATPYLIAGGNSNLLPIFEAAHSIMLALFSAPQNVELTAKHLPFYLDALFKVFPHDLSPRQFRLAFRNLVRIASPPTGTSAAEPMLAATLLEIVHERALQASTTSLPPNTTVASVTSPLPGQQQNIVPRLSEQAVLVSTLIDALPSISLELLEEWLPLVARLINHIPDDLMRDHCKKHFWDTLVGGEMDPERSQICVTWWTSRGGRDLLFYGEELTQALPDDPYVMSGALPEEKTLSKL